MTILVEQVFIDLIELVGGSAKRKVIQFAQQEMNI